MSREFLNRTEATYQLGLMEARTHANRAAEIGALVAVVIGGVLFEALEGEVLHAQVELRARGQGAVGPAVYGWTVCAEEQIGGAV
jgi:hypothetical protein